MANTFTSRDTLKTKLLAAVSAATTADQIVKLSRSIEKANLDDDADLETALDTKVSAMADSASTEDIEKLAFGVKKLRTPASAAAPTSTQVAEGSSNLYVTDSRVRSSFSASGDLSYDSGTGVLSYTALPDALTVYATVGDLPSSGVASGAKGIVEENKKLYIFTGASWVGVGLVDQKPNFTTTPDGSYALSPGSDTVITLAATDPQGDPITYSYQVTAGALGGTTVSQADNVFTISASSSSADEGSFSLSFTASDGTNLTTTTPSEFTLTFGFDWDSIDVYTRYNTGNEGEDYGRWIAASGTYFATAKPKYFNLGMIDIFDSSAAGGALGDQLDYIIPTWISSSTGQGQVTNNGVGLSWFTGTYNPSRGGKYIALDGNLVAFNSHDNDGDVQVWQFNTTGQPKNGSQTIAKFMFTPRDSYLPQQVQDDTYYNGWSSYGQAIDMGGGYLAIGAQEAKNQSIVNPAYRQPGAGKVFVYDLSQADEASAFANGYVLERPTDPYNGTAGQSEKQDIRFGASVAIAASAGLLAVSCPEYMWSSTDKVGGAVFIYNLSDGSYIRTINVSNPDGNGDTSQNSRPGAEHRAMAITPDGSKLVIGDQQGRQSGNSIRGVVSVFDVSTGAYVNSWRAHTQVTKSSSKWGQSVDISPEGGHVVFGAQDEGNSSEGKFFFGKVDGTNFPSGPNLWNPQGPGYTGFGADVAFGDDQIYASAEVQGAVITYKS